MTKKSSKTRKQRLNKAEREADELISNQVEEIDAAIQKLEVKMRPYERLRERMEKLQRARSALLGGSRLTGSGTRGLRQEDVVRLVGENPGATTQDLADKAGSTYNAMFAHLSRGRDERFLGKNGHWWLRDPKNGINTIEDVEEDTE